jgi:hypothetical protein
MQLSSKAAENGMGQLSRMYSITGSRSHWDTAKNVFSVTGVHRLRRPLNVLVGPASLY